MEENLLQERPLDKGKVADTNSQKVVIKDPLTKQVIHLPPKATSSISTAPLSTVGLTKNEKKKLKKKHKKKDLLLSSSGQDSIVLIENSEVGNEHISTDPASLLPTCVTSKQDWEGLDSNGSKDSHFWANYHAAQVDLSQLDRPEAYPFMFQVESEEEQLDFSSDSHLQPLSSSSDTSRESIDLISLQEAYHKTALSIDQKVMEQTIHSKEPPSSSVDEAVYFFDNEVIELPPSSQISWAQEVEAADALPLLEAYHKGHFDVQVSPKDVQVSPSQSWADEVEVAESTPLSFDELVGAPIKAKDTQATSDEVTTTSKNNTKGHNLLVKEVETRNSKAQAQKPFISSLGVQVTVKTKIKEADNRIADTTDDKVPKELFFFPPRPSTPAGAPFIHASKKFNKEFLKPP